MTTTRKPQIGSVSTGTLRTLDLIDAFRDELRWLGCTEQIIDDAETVLDAEDSDDEVADNMLERLFDALDARALPYMEFGAHQGNASDFGWWPNWEQMNDAERDGELMRINDASDVPAAHVEGVEAYMVVNDHGNVSMYVSNGKRYVLEWVLWTFMA